MHQLMARSLRAGPQLLVLALVGWLVPASLMLAYLAATGFDTPSSTALIRLAVANVGIVIGHAVVVPAMFDLLHHGGTIRSALRASLSHVTANLVLVAPIPLATVIGGRLWPELYGTVAETLMVQALLAMPFVLWCQVAWMQQAVEGGDLRDVLRDTFWTLRLQPLAFAARLVPAYVACWIVAMPFLTQAISGPLAVSLLTVPYVTVSWVTWVHAVGHAPPVLQLDQPVAAAEAAAAALPVPSAVQEPARSAAAPTPMPVVTGNAGTHHALETGAGTSPAGAWIVLDPSDALSCSVRVADDRSREWGVFLWSQDGSWHELPQLWNDGRHIVAYGYPRSERCFLAVRRRDGSAHARFDLWISIVTNRLAHPTPVSHAAA